MATSKIKKPYPLAVMTVSGTTSASGALFVNLSGVFVFARTLAGGGIVLKRSDGYVSVYTPGNSGLMPVANTAVTIDVYYIPN